VKKNNKNVNIEQAGKVTMIVLPAKQIDKTARQKNPR
jgi:hypothetical protein